MTTIIVDSKNKEVFSDSRRTIEERNKVTYDNKGEKIFKHKSGRLLAGCWGSINIALPELRRLGFIVQTTDCTTREMMFSEESSNIVIINSYNEHILCLSAERTCFNMVSFKRKYITEYNRVWAGSGGDVVTKLFDLDKGFCHTKAIRYAAMKDISTDNRVQTRRL